jgi:hypothetical protein
MYDADIFHSAMVGHGGRLDTASLRPATAEGLNHVAKRARGFLQTAAAALPRMPPIYFDFIDNWKVNALAFRHEGRYFIGVYRGAVATLVVLFDRMLADPEILPFIGNPEEEVANLPLLPDVGPDFVQSVASVPTFPRPRDPARRITAHKLAELALDFLTAHEFAHIANGHVDYTEESQGISVIEEVGGAPAPKTRESALISQTMEMDADGTAVLINLSSEWGKIAGSIPRPGPPWTEFYDYPGKVSLQWSWAVSSLFRILGDARLTARDALEDYPRPRLRSVIIQQAAGRVPRPGELHTHPALVGDEFYRIPMTIRAAQRDVKGIFSRLTGRPEATEGLDDAWGDVGRSQMLRLQDYWRTKLKEQLLRFAYRPLNSYGDSSEEATGEDT